MYGFRWIAIVCIGLFVLRFVYEEASQGRFGHGLQKSIRDFDSRRADWFSTPEEPDFSSLEEFGASGYTVYDLNEQKVVTTDDVDKKVVPASLTKLFTIQFALEHLDPEEIVEVGTGSISYVKKGGSTAGLLPGQVSVEDLMQASLIPSGNDACYALAAAAGRKLMQDEGALAKDSIARFSDELREYLDKNGYRSTKITDPAGDAEKDSTSAKDLIRITTEVLENPAVDQAVRFDHIVPDPGISSSEIWLTTNAYLNPNAGMYHPNITGIKTGTLSGTYNLILRYERKGDAYLLMALGQPSRQELDSTMMGLIYELDRAYGGPGASPIMALINKVQVMFHRGK